MWLLSAATAPDSPDQSYALLNAVFIFAGVVVTVAGGVITTLINKSAKTGASPPAPDPAAPAPDPGIEVRTIVRMLQERADDCDAGRDLTDRRVDRHEIYLEMIARKLGVDLPHPPPHPRHHER